MVSVVMITYGHEEFISQAINSILEQECNFEFELIVANDHSPDETDKVVVELINRHPKGKSVRYFNHDENIGMAANFAYALYEAKGEFIAICEGDDYWIDPTKLQRQVDFLRTHNEYILVTENGQVLNTINNTKYDFNHSPEGDIDINSLLLKRQFPTASVLFRSIFLDDTIKTLNYHGDTILWCYLAMKGKVKYFPIVSSVYRRGMQGIVESTNKLKWASLMECWNNEISGFLPNNFDRNIFNERNYSEYWKAMISSLQEKKYSNAFICIKKCAAIKPVSTVNSVIKFYLDKILRKSV